MIQDSLATSPSGKVPAKKAYRRPEFLTYGILSEVTNSMTSTGAMGDGSFPPINKT